MAPNLTLMGEAAPLRRDPPREVFRCDALDWAQRRALAGHRQFQRWLTPGSRGDGA